jgi:DNA-directed RNA polymerase specialized sigma24 family protein
MKDSNQSQKKTKMINVNLDVLLEEYNLGFDDIFTDIDERLLAISDKLEKLTASEKIVLILYAELQSYRKVAKVLGFSHSTVMKYIKETREKLC